MPGGLVIPSAGLRKYKQILAGYDILHLAYCKLCGMRPGVVKDFAEYFLAPQYHRMALGIL
jgi:hypothetical protein